MSSCCTTPQTCCPATAWPALESDHQPEGSVITLDQDGKLSAYVVGAESSGRAVLVLPDIFGIEGGNNRAICDHLAQHGFYVVMPDYFYGGGVVKSADWMAGFADWAKSFPYERHVAPLEAALQYIEGKGITKTGTIGFCWGCWVSFKLGADDRFKARIRAAVDCHPSVRVEELFFGGSVDALAAATKDGFPHLLLSAGDDPDNVKTAGSVIGLLGADKGSRVVEFPAMNHGWVNRGDTAQPAVADEVKRALTEAVQFLTVHTQ